MRKLLFLYAVCLLLVFPVVANATPISADLKGTRSTDAGTVTANDGWSGDDNDNNNGFEISWDISYDLPTLLYTYKYTVSGVGNNYLSFGLSHLNVEVTDPFSEDQFNMTIAEAVDRRNSNRDVYLESSTILFVLGDDDDIYAIKWDMETIFRNNKDIVEFVISFITDKEPVWGNFYANANDDGIVAEAWNLGFDLGTDPDENTIDFTNWIARPDGANVSDDPPSHAPEPATMLLLGSGLIGIAVSGKKRLKKRNG